MQTLALLAEPLAARFSFKYQVITICSFFNTINIFVKILKVFYKEIHFKTLNINFIYITDFMNFKCIYPYIYSPIHPPLTHIICDIAKGECPPFPYHNETEQNIQHGWEECLLFKKIYICVCLFCIFVSNSSTGNIVLRPRRRNSGRE